MRVTTKYSQKTGFTQQTPLESQNNKTSTLFIHSQTAARGSIVKALDKLGKLHINDNMPRTATVHTDSRITLQSLKNTKNHNYLIEEIKKKATALEKRNWTKGSYRNLQKRVS